MVSWLQRLLGRNPPAPDREEVLGLRREIQDLNLQLQEAQSRLTAFQQERERQSQEESVRMAEAVSRRMEGLFKELAGPVSQLFTQAHLLENENKPVQARDILSVARRFIRVLENEGLTVKGAVGEQTTFDPDRHAPLGADSPERGSPVVVRFPAITWNGRILRKAGVEKGGRR